MAEKALARTCRVTTAQDLRWRRCHIKSTALLSNVLHLQRSHEQGAEEVLLYNAAGELTEAGVIATPILDNQILPGVTRWILLDILAGAHIPVQERVVTMDKVRNADEVWLSSSSREIVPVTHIDGQPVADGRAGDLWLRVQTLFSRHKFDY